MPVEFLESIGGSDSKLDIPNLGIELTVRLPHDASGVR